MTMPTETNKYAIVQLDPTPPRQQGDLSVQKLAAGIESIQLKIENGLKNVSFRLDGLEEKSQPTGRNKVFGSNNDHGQSIYDSLMLSGNIRDAPEGEGPAIISPDIYGAALQLGYDQQRPHENVLVNLYTPSLIQVVVQVNPGLRLVNSEYFQWLRCMSGNPKADMKPDLFSAHHSLVEFSPAYRNAPECDMSRLFGKFVSWECRASIHCIWDAKWSIDMAAFGEKCKYLQITGEDSVDHNGVVLRLKGVLFDIHEFWMIHSSGSTIVDVVKCKCNQPGSRQLLADFLGVVDPWISAVSDLCQKLNVEIVDFSLSGHKQSAFLGAGANRRVFKLSNGLANR